MATKIRLTPALKAHAVEKFGVDAKADDAAFTKAVLGSVLKGKTTKAELDKLMASTALKPGKTTPTKTKSGEVVTKAMMEEALQKTLKENNVLRDETPAGLFIKGSKAHIQVMEAADRYSTVTKSAVMPEFPGLNGTGKLEGGNSKNWNAGQQVYHPIDRRPLDMPSQRDYAIIGAYVKKVATESEKAKGHSVPPSWQYNKHDRELLQYAAANHKWGCSLRGNSLNDIDGEINKRMLSHMETKSILDDTISAASKSRRSCSTTP